MDNATITELLATCMTSMDAQSAMWHLCTTEGEIASHARELKALKPYAQGFGSVPKLRKAFAAALAAQAPYGSLGSPAQRVAAAYESAFDAAAKRSK